MRLLVLAAEDNDAVQGMMRTDADSASVEAFGPGRAARKAAGRRSGARRGEARADRGSTNGHAASAAHEGEAVTLVSSEMSSHALHDGMSEVDES